MDEESQQAFAAGIKRQRDTYGPEAETPRTPYGNLQVGSLTSPVMPIEGRIAGLCKQVADASHALVLARTRCAEALGQREQAELKFANVANELLSAINEHREGTPEHVPSAR